MLTNGCSTRSRTHSADDSIDEFGTDEPGSPYASLTGNDRKRRRGVIEKRRRDRINCSLADLKRLVPDSNHKPGSSKLEKAEILQLTVEFLQRLHKEGYVISSEARALELRRYGFKDCLMEVQRLLSTFEGAPISGDDLRRHLLSHLQNCERQRDTEAQSYLAQIAAVTNAMLAQTSATPEPSIDSTTATTTCCPQTRSKSFKHQPSDSKSHPNLVKAKQPTNSDSAPTNHISSNPSAVGRSTYSREQTGTNTFYPTSYCPHQQTDSRLGDSNHVQGRNGYLSGYNIQPYTVTSEVPIDSTKYQQDLSSSLLCMNKNSGCNHESIPASNYALNNVTFPCSTILTTTTTNSTTSTTSISTTTDLASSNNNTTTLGQNESQSTSSPTFHSTPEDSDLGLSPLMKTTNTTIPPNSDLFGSNSTETQTIRSQYFVPTTDPMVFDDLGSRKHQTYLNYTIPKLQPPVIHYQTESLGQPMSDSHFDQSPMKADNSSAQGNTHYQHNYPYYDIHSTGSLMYLGESSASSDTRLPNMWKSKTHHTGSLDYPDYNCWPYPFASGELHRSS